MRLHRPVVYFFAVFAVALLANVPAISGDYKPREINLSVRQTAESLFQNGLRNAQTHNDVFGQVRALQKTKDELLELQEESFPLSVADYKFLAKRDRQLRKMISRGSR